MTSNKQKNDGFPIPDPIDGYTDFVCYQVLVPNVREYRTAFVGHLRQLEKWWNWDKSYLAGDTRAKEAAAYWVKLLEFLEPDNCEVNLFDIRQKPDAPCIIQKAADGETWVDAVDMQLCPPRIRVNNGVIEWQDGEGVWHPLENGDERVDGEAPIFYPSNPDGACLQAENITAIYQTTLTEIRAGVVAGKVAVAIAATITGIMGIFISPALIGTISLVITGIALDAGESALDTMLSSDHLDNFKCQIYCNIEADGSITAADFTALRAGMATWATGVELSLIQYYLDGFGSVGLQRQGVAGGITTGSCEDCGDCEPPTLTFWHILDHEVEAEANLYPSSVDVGTTDTDGSFISVREGTSDKEIIFVVTGTFAVGAKTGKRYEVYGKYDHAGFYGGWQSNGFENRWELGYKALTTGTWYGGVPFDLSSVVLPSDGSEVLVQSFDAFFLGDDPNPENHAIAYYLFGRNYNGWRITRIEEVDA